MTHRHPLRHWASNNRVNLSVRSITALAHCASAAPVRPAGYAERWADALTAALG